MIKLLLVGIIIWWLFEVFGHHLKELPLFIRNINRSYKTNRKYFLLTFAMTISLFAFFYVFYVLLWVAFPS